MAQTLEEFLVSIKFNIDQPSQQTFFTAMKRAATSVAGVAGELTGLGLAVMKISEVMAQSGEKLYWMSQRLGDSVADIQGMAFAMSNLGESAEQAAAGIERFGAWTRQMGPAATGYLRSLGITATDTVGRMRQLGEYFRTHGGTQADQGSLAYSLARMRAQGMGIDEQTMLALSSGRMEQNLQQAGLMQRLVWGKNWQSGPQQFAAESVKVMNQFREMGFFFQNLEQQFGLGLFKAIDQPLKNINLTLHQMLPDIQEFMQHMVHYAPLALNFLNGVIKAFDVMLKLANVAMDTFDKMPAAVQHGIEVFLALPAAIKLIGSPLFWVLGGLTALLLLLDDYQHWENDQKTGKRTSHFDWATPDAMFKGIGKALAPIEKIREDMDAWFKDMSGIDGLFTSIAVTLGLIVARMGLIKTLGGLKKLLLGTAEEAGSGGTPGAGAGVGILGILGGLFRLTLIADAFHKAFSDPKGFWNEWEKAWTSGHFTWGKQDPNPPSKGQSGGGLGDWLSRMWGHISGTDPQEGRQHSSLDTSGRYQTASLGWMGPPGGGGGSAYSDQFYTGERFYTLFSDSFSGLCDKLDGILVTLTDMADAVGASHDARDAGGGGSGGDGDFGPMLPPGAPPEQQEARLRQIEQRESGGRNVWNYMHASDPSHYTASGYWQMIDSTWRHAAQLAGIDASRYPHAMDAPYELQYRAALALINEQGERPWATSARGAGSAHLSHQPLGADDSGGGGPGWAGRALVRQHGGIHNETTINVVAPSPGSAAAQVAEHQNRVFEHHVRYAKGTLLA